MEPIDEEPAPPQVVKEKQPDKRKRKQTEQPGQQRDDDTADQPRNHTAEGKGRGKGGSRGRGKGKDQDPPHPQRRASNQHNTMNKHSRRYNANQPRTASGRNVQRNAQTNERLMAAQAESAQSENVAICARCDYVGTITTGTCCERCTAELPTKATRSVVCFRCKNIWKRLYECKVTGDESCAMCFAEMHSCKLCGSHIDGKHHPREDLCNQCRSVEIAIDSFLEDGEGQVTTPSSELNLAECQTITRLLFVTQFTSKNWWGDGWTHPGDLHDTTGKLR